MNKSDIRAAIAALPFVDPVVFGDSAHVMFGTLVECERLEIAVDARDFRAVVLRKGTGGMHIYSMVEDQCIAEISGVLVSTMLYSTTDVVRIDGRRVATLAARLGPENVAKMALYRSLTGIL